MAFTNPFLEIISLTKRIGERVLFHDISFTISERQHVGLIAKNGTGKTTLLNIIAGKDGYDEGKIVAKNGIRIGYLEQTPRYDPDMNIEEACLGHENDLKTKQILTKLKMTDYHMPFRMMS